MSQCAEAIAEFGHTLGVPNLCLNANGMLQLELNNGLKYSLEEIESGLLVQLFMPYALIKFNSLFIKKRLLKLADYRKYKKKPILVLRYLQDREENLILQLPLLFEELNAQTLDEAMEMLLHYAEYALQQREMV